VIHSLLCTTQRTQGLSDRSFMVSEPSHTLSVHLRCIALHCVALRCIALHRVASRLQRRIAFAVFQSSCMLYKLGTSYIYIVHE